MLPIGSRSAAGRSTFAMLNSIENGRPGVASAYTESQRVTICSSVRKATTAYGP